MNQPPPQCPLSWITRVTAVALNFLHSPQLQADPPFRDSGVYLLSPPPLSNPGHLGCQHETLSNLPSNPTGWLCVAAWGA